MIIWRPGASMTEPFIDTDIIIRFLIGDPAGAGRVA
jgi:hypothetical protein